MDNRLALTLAVTAGYVLGRTKKAKWAIGAGSMILGKRLNLSPRQLAGTLTEQIAKNPQFSEVRDQLRGDLRGVGKAATGALVNRRLNSLADNLHERTLDVRDRIDSGELTGRLGGGRDEPEDAEDTEDADGARAEDDDDTVDDERGDAGEPRARDERRARRSPAKKPAAKKPAAGKAPAKRSGGEKRTAPARKTASSAKKTSAKKAAGTTKTAARRSGGGGRG